MKYQSTMAATEALMSAETKRAIYEIMVIINILLTKFNQTLDVRIWFFSSCQEQ